MKTITELKEDKQLLLDAINILDTITEEENENITRTDDDFELYESWAITDAKKEIMSKIGLIEVQLTQQEEEEGEQVKTIIGDEK